MIGVFEVNDSESRMNVYSMIGKSSCILAVDFKRLCEDKERIKVLRDIVKFKRGKQTLKLRNEVIIHNKKKMLR